MRALTCLLAFLIVPCILTAAEVSLFDGKTLNGWDGEKTKVWRVEDGVIVGGSMEGNPQNEFLTTQKSYKNFRLKLEYKLIGTEGFVNGGVQIRSRRTDTPPNEMIGYQADIGAGYTGCLYDESRRKKMLATANKETIEKLEKKGDWNSYEIVAESQRVQISLNGMRVLDFTEREPGIEQEGLIGLQIHGDCKAIIYFRNIVIEELAKDLVPEQAEILQRFGEPGVAKSEDEKFSEGKFALKPNELIVFTGQENLVRAQKSGDLEARLGLGFADKAPRFRSMAWEGDTVYEQWRDLNFGSWSSQLEAVGADIIVAQYGQMEAFDGVEKIPAFISAYHKLLDEFASQTKRLVLISPIPFEKVEDAYLPDLTSRNADVAAYAKAIAELAKQRGAVYVDLYAALSKRQSDDKKLTDNGLHLNEYGLAVVAEIITTELGAQVDKARDLTALKNAIAEKNRLWFDCWRPANWSFVYGDRVTQLFGKAGGNEPSLRETFEKHKPMIAALDEQIQTLISGSELSSSQLVQPQAQYVETETMIDVQKQMESFTIADGYEINLFASEAEGVAKPTQFCWDERGRLWVACSPTYPHSLPGRKPSDYILVLEDTDGDGKADKSFRFAEGLTMVQGLELGNGGLYVCDFDQILHLKDTDGDGVADQKKIIYAGFGIGDTHQLVNSICYGPDGMLWFSQGLHAYSRVESPWGMAILEKSGLWRMNQRTQRLESFFNGGKAGHNCWGVAFDDYAQIFHKSGDRPFGYYTVPGLAKNAQPEEYHPIGALFDTSPKTTALEIIGTKGLPADIQGCALIGGYFGSVIELHRLIDDGAGFRSEQLPKLLRSSVDSFRPVDVSVGPDGSMYAADWFNPVIGHYQASYADPRRDRRHGRIWRISAKGYPKVKQPDLASMKPAELLEQLKSPERWTRYQAKRLLFNGNTADVVAAADNFVKTVKDEQLLLEVTGVFQSHQVVRPELVEQLLNAKDARVRAYGARVVTAWHESLPNALDLLGKAVRDENARVRLEGVVSASYLPQPEAVEVAVASLDYPQDKFSKYALAQTVRGLQNLWEKPFAEGKLTFGGKAEQVAYIKNIAGSGPVREHPGKAVYDALCLNCHQPGGVGLAGVYPPLNESEWVTGDKDALIKIILHGLTGPITVKGQEYGVAAPIPMPPMGLTDQQMADVLTYIRGETFSNNADAVTVEEVKKVRDQNSSRTAFWTAEELKKP